MEEKCMKIEESRICFNSGAVLENGEAGDTVAWPGQHWAQDPNIVERLDISLKDDGKDALIGQIGFAMKFMAFHELQTIRERDGVVLSLEPEEKNGRILAFSYFNDWWTRPYFIGSFQEIPENTGLILYEKEGGYRSFLAMPGDVFRTRFCAGETEGEIRLILSSDASGYSWLDETFLVSTEDEDPYRCVYRCMERACALRGIPMRTQRTYPEALEKIGWCSWDAFYQEVSEEGILQKARELKEKKVPAGWLLIDDGWHDAIENRLCGFDAKKEKFPDGLAGTVRKTKEILPDAQIGVWHAFSGYWGGIMPDSPLAKGKSGDLFVSRQGRVLPKAEKEAAADFFGDWQRRLSSWGISFVKVDSQSSLRSQYQSNAPLGIAARRLHEGLDEAAFSYMNGNLINCMGMAMENVLSRPMSAVSRNSDDFVPLRENGFEEHLLQNTFNSLWHGCVYYGDWDMFWSSHPDAEKHALLRALSGGPVYVSDRVGETDPRILSKLCYSDGTILRAPQPALPTKDCLFEDPMKTGYLKLKNHCAGVYYLAVFAFGEKEAQVTAGLSDFVCSAADPAEKNEYAYYCPQTGEGGIWQQGEKKIFSVSEKGYLLILAAPVREGIAVFGSPEYDLSSHVLVSVESPEEKHADTSPRIPDIHVRGEYPVLLYAKQRPEHVLLNGEQAQMSMLPEEGFILAHKY